MLDKGFPLHSSPLFLRFLETNIVFIDFNLNASFGRNLILIGGSQFNSATALVLNNNKKVPSLLGKREGGTREGEQQGSVRETRERVVFIFVNFILGGNLGFGTCKFSGARRGALYLGMFSPPLLPLPFHSLSPLSSISLQPLIVCRYRTMDRPNEHKTATSD